MNPIKVVIGITLIIIGAILLIFAWIPGFIYGPLLIVIGILFIIFSKSEEEIEQRKDINTKKNKK